MFKMIDSMNGGVNELIWFFCQDKYMKKFNFIKESVSFSILYRRYINTIWNKRNSIIGNANIISC